MRFLSQLFMLRHMPNRLCLLDYSPKCAFWCNCLCLFIHEQKSGRELNLVSAAVCVCALFRCVCRKLQKAMCLRTVLISSPDMGVWTRMHALAVMHRWTLCANVDSSKIKVLIYTTDYRYFTCGIDASYHQTSYWCIDPFQLIVRPLPLISSGELEIFKGYKGKFTRIE